MSDPAATLDRLVAKAEQLYSLPTVAMEVLQLTDNPQVDTRALKECIENDPALTGKILRVVNSSLFGLSRVISDLNQALAFLGTKPLKLLVLGFSLPSGLYAGIESRTLGWYWRHTLTKAVAARELSERLWHVPGDDAFIAGLLQDIGLLLLVQQLGEPYARFLDRVVGSRMDLAAMELETLGFVHAELSSRLLARWRLPENLVAAVAADAQKLPANVTASQAALPRILHLAELVAQLLADAQTAALKELLDFGRDYRNAPADELESLLHDIEEKVRQLASVLSLQLPDGLECVDLLAEAHRQMTAGGQPGRRRPDSRRPVVRGAKRSAAARRQKTICWWRSCGLWPRRCGRRRPDALDLAAPPSPAAIAPVPLQADPGLLGWLAAAGGTCRQSRRPLSLLLVQLDRPDELLLLLGAKDFEELRRLLEATCRGVDHPWTTCLAHGEAGFALILPNCQRRLAVELGDQLMREMYALKCCSARRRAAVHHSQRRRGHGPLAAEEFFAGRPP